MVLLIALIDSHSDPDLLRVSSFMCARSNWTNTGYFLRFSPPLLVGTMNICIITASCIFSSVHIQWFRLYNALIYLFSDPAGLRATYLWSCSEFSWTPYARIWREMYLNWAKCKRVVHLISGKIEIDRLFDHWAVLSLINWSVRFISSRDLAWVYYWHSLYIYLINIIYFTR